MFSSKKELSLEQPQNGSTPKTLPDLVVFPPYFVAENREHSQWTISVEGMATRPGRIDKMSTRFSMSVMRHLMKASRENLKDPMFLERVAPFVAKGIRGSNVDVQVGKSSFRLQRKTNGAGFFKARLRFSAMELNDLLGLGAGTEAEAIQAVQATSSLPLKVDVRHVSIEPKRETALQVPWHGWSVISDIDDTIKDSQVSPLHILLTNTFLNEFRSVTGMAELYRQWHQRGLLFHYVSSSPWQLFQPILKLCQSDCFPEGTFHLRSFRLSQDLWKKMLIFRQRGKMAIIRGMVRSLPERKFILVGDSGEKDPEIYCKLARRYPDQIRAVFIRDLDHRQLTSKRWNKLNEGLPPEKVRPFKDAAALDEMAADVIQ